MDRVTRKELKTDHIGITLQHGAEAVAEQRKQLYLYGGIGLAVLLIALGIAAYLRNQHSVRQEALTEAMGLENAAVGQTSPNEYIKVFATQAEKDQAVNKAFTDIATKYSGTDEGYVAEYYLASKAADKGDMAQAEKRFKLVADNGNKNYSSLAKLSLAQIYAGEGKTADAESLIRSVIDHPTAFVSKDEATIALAHVLAPTKPQEARKLLEPLRANQRSAVSRAAINALSDINGDK